MCILWPIYLFWNNFPKAEADLALFSKEWQGWPSSHAIFVSTVWWQKTETQTIEDRIKNVLAHVTKSQKGQILNLAEK